MILKIFNKCWSTDDAGSRDANASVNIHRKSKNFLYVIASKISIWKWTDLAEESSLSQLLLDMTVSNIIPDIKEEWKQSCL